MGIGLSGLVVTSCPFCTFSCLLDQAEGQYIASCSDDCDVIIWKHFPEVVSPGSINTGHGKWRNVCSLQGQHERTVFSIDWGSQNNCLATGAADNAIRVFKQCESENSDSKYKWKSSTQYGQCIHVSGPSFAMISEVKSAHQGDVNCVRWSPSDESLLVSAGDDGAISMWRWIDPDL